MSRFGPDPLAFFEAVYTGTAPWDVGAAQPAMAALLDEFPPRAPVLDLGCASGDLAIHLARLGCRTIGIDFVESAIAEANRRMRLQPPEVSGLLDFRVADAMRPTTLGEQFGSVTDSGFLHLLDPAQSDSLIEEVQAVLPSGGRYYLHEFAVEFPIENVPRAVTEDELRARFTAEHGWRLLEVRPAEFLNRVAAPTPAIVACVEKL